MRNPLWNRGFLALFVTQFFEAANDNVIKTLLSFAVAALTADALLTAPPQPPGPWAGAYGSAAQGLVAFFFTVPFIVFSALGGSLADKFSKRRLTVMLKIISVGVALLTLVAFRADHAVLALVAFVAFSTVSAFFGPVKYGMIAELVAPEEIVRANGIINMGTNLAAITGVVLGGIVAERFRTAHDPASTSQFGYWLPGLVMLALVGAALGACAFLPPLAPQAPTLRVQVNPLSTYQSVLREMARGPILGVAFAWTFFYFLAATVLSILPDYRLLLAVSETKASGLMAVMAVMIGIGCTLAAYLCGRSPNPRFVTFGAIALAVVFAALGFLAPTYWLVAALLALLGLVAGFYIIPLQAMLQIFAPGDERGRYLGTANAISFAMAALGGGLYSLLRALHVPSNRMFLVLAALTSVVALVCFPWGRRLQRALVARRAADATLAAP